MGRVLHIMKSALIQTLGGYTEEQIHPLVLRATVLGALARQGKYDRISGLKVLVNVRIIQKLCDGLGFHKYGLRSERRKPSVPRMEIVIGRGPILLPASSLQVVDEARAQCLLAKIAGPTIGAQLDIQRECLPSPEPVKQLQGEVKVFDVVPPYYSERVQPAAQA